MRTQLTRLAAVGLAVAALAACGSDDNSSSNSAAAPAASDAAAATTAGTPTSDGSSTEGSTATSGGAASTPRPLTAGPQGPLDPGTYVTASPFLSRLTFSLPPKWNANVGGPYAVFLDPRMSAVSDDEGLVKFVIFDKVFADPCHPDQGLLDPLPGGSVDDLANALASLPSLDATTPTDVTVAGYHGKELTLTAPTGGNNCSFWQLPLGAHNTMVPGQVDRVWILDVDGQRLVIDAPEVPSESAADKASVQAILDSIAPAG